MATVNEQGFTATDLSEYLERIQANWKSIFGEELSFDDDTPQGEWTGAEALTLVEFDEVLADIAASLDIDQAKGVQLDNLCAILSILRKGETKSNVNAQLTGVPLSFIASGSKAKLTTGEVFVLKEAVTLDASGEGVGFFEAEDSGAINIPVNTLTKIVTPVAGWETVDNSAQGASGTATEEDYVFKKRYYLQLAINAVTPIEAVIAGVYSLDGVVEVTGVENDTGAAKTIDGIEIAAHTIAIAVLGGSDSEIAAMIRQKKTLGTPTQGDTTVNVAVTKPNSTTVIQNLDINFYRVTEIPIEIAIELETDARFPSNGDDQIKEYLKAYFDGSDQFTEDFELDGMSIAESVYKARLYTPINRVPGHVVTSLTLGTVDESYVDVDVVPINLDQKAKLEIANVTITYAS